MTAAKGVTPKFSVVLPAELCALLNIWLTHEAQISLQVERGKLVMGLYTDHPPQWPPLAECTIQNWASRGWCLHPAADYQFPVWVHAKQRLLLEADDDGARLTLCQSRREWEAELKDMVAFFADATPLAMAKP